MNLVKKQNTFDVKALTFDIFVDEEIMVEILNKIDDSLDELVAERIITNLASFS